jgi:hypothetical protein
MRRLLTVVFILSTILVQACSSSDNPPDRPIQVIINDVPYTTEEYLRIGYTLKTWEYEKDGLELMGITVLDKATNEALLVIDKENLPKIYKDPLPTNPYFTWDTLTSYYISIQLPIPLDQAPPEKVFHSFLFMDTASGNPVTVEGAE